MSEIKIVAHNNFDKMVMKEEDPVILVYWSKDCRHCKMFEDTIKEINTIFKKEAKIYRFDIIDEES